MEFAHASCAPIMETQAASEEPHGCGRSRPSQQMTARPIGEGRAVAAAHEERFMRRKHEAGFPANVVLTRFVLFSHVREAGRLLHFLINCDRSPTVLWAATTNPRRSTRWQTYHGIARQR